MATKSGDTVAVKVMKRSVVKKHTLGRPCHPTAPQQNSALEAVLGEVAAMKQLEHPNLVRLYAFIDDPQRDELYLVLEYVDGGHLGQCVERGEVVPEATLTLWLCDTADGLAHMHSHGIAHRDLKPENLMWSGSERRVKIGDFGTAVAGAAPSGEEASASAASGSLGGSLGGSSIHVTQTAGTPSFFAPEMCTMANAAGSAKKGYSARLADLWAFGVCLHMWLYLRPPFEAETVHLLVVAIREGAEAGSVRTPPGVRGGADQPPTPVSPALLAVLASLMAVDPNARTLTELDALRARRDASERTKVVRGKRRPWQLFCCGQKGRVAPEP
jgi:[calcium/calmodulin-dependent protein kinase] kinase